MQTSNEKNDFSLNEFVHDKEAPSSVGEGDGDDYVEIADWVTFCGNLAVMTSMLVTLVPLATLADIRRTKSVGSLPLLPFTIMVVKAFTWSAYGALKSERMLWVPNLLALPLSIACFCIYTRYSPQESPQLPGKVSHHVFLILGLSAICFLSSIILPTLIAVRAVGFQAVLTCVIRD
jgi:uncharacterized protein with PQ loop repeat